LPNLELLVAISIYPSTTMTERLYYIDPNLTEFEARFVSIEHATENHPHLGIVLDRTAFYPTSGGQIFDTGFLTAVDEPNGHMLRVTEVLELPHGDVAHCIEVPEGGIGIQKDALLRGIVDRPRRRDHMQQHTGQHLLSAVFLELFQAPTVSFHMGEETCTIDLDVKALSAEQIREAERRANEIVSDNVPVEIKFATRDEARQMGVRKIPPEVTDKLRLIEIKGHDLTACGGTHVSRSGQIGAILVRKTEKVKQGMRVEFVCGARAVAAARRDIDTLTSAAALFSSHIYDVPEQIRKALDEAKAACKREQKTQAVLAEFMAARIVAETPETNRIRLLKRTFADRDLGFIKLLAQKLAASPNVVALLASTMTQPSLVFAQSAGGNFDMGALMKETMSSLGGRGGGTRDMAQGGAPAGADVEPALDGIAAKILAG
jgi:alanyl-tRNA synthetase